MRYDPPGTMTGSHHARSSARAACELKAWFMIRDAFSVRVVLTRVFHGALLISTLPVVSTVGY